jgi:HEAT repeat protein
MPRETIRKLAEDTERLLVAGAHLATGDAELTNDKIMLDALIARLGTKAPPVLSRLASQVEKAASAKADAQAEELLTLAASVAQVRAAQAQPAAATTDTTPLMAVPEVATPCNARDLYALHDALVQSGKGRLERINEAVARGDAGDLRLVHAVIQAMGDPYVGDRVANEVVPQFGRAVVEPILAKLRFPGKAVDGRRLRALVAVQREEALGVVERALSEGSLDVREAALDAVADHLPGVPRFEQVALEVLAKERAAGVRRAAVRALKRYGSDASLAALLEALDDPRTQQVAGEALAASTHPNVVDELLARLDAATRAKKSKEPDAEQQKRAAAARTILAALAGHHDPRIPKVARPLIDAHGPAAARALLKSGSREDVGAVADLLKGKDTELYAVARDAACLLEPEETAERLLAPFSAKDRESKHGLARCEAIAKQAPLEFKPTGERWVRALAKLTREAPKDVASHAATLLGKARHPDALEPLCAFLSSAKGAEQVRAAVWALAILRDPRAIDALIPYLQGHDWNVSWPVRSAILDMADPGTVGKVRAAVAALKDPDDHRCWAMHDTLRQLERKFPGH